MASRNAFRTVASFDRFERWVHMDVVDVFVVGEDEWSDKKDARSRYNDFLVVLIALFSFS